MLLQDFDTSDDGVRLPILVLAVRGYGNFSQPDLWRIIKHQGGGFACTQFEKACIILPIREELRSKIEELTDKWLDSCVGGLGAPSLTDANEYNEDLKKIGLTCETSYSEMKEGIYPFDTSLSSLRIVTDFDLPEDLDDLLVFRSDIDKMFGIINRWQAYILGENCD